MSVPATRAGQPVAGHAEHGLGQGAPGPQRAGAAPPGLLPKRSRNQQ